MKIVSFVPAATKMIYDMGLQDHLYGVTFECPAEAADQPKVVRYLFEGHTYSSLEIDRIFSASKAQGKSLYWIDEELLQNIKPDLIITQDTCEVCIIDAACTLASISNLDISPELLIISPDNLDDVFACALKIARAVGREDIALQYLSGLKNTIDDILEKLRLNRAPLKRVMIMEWIKPIYNCGHWIPYQIAAAGGVDMLSNPGGDSVVNTWDKVLRYNPEVIVIAPCGFNMERSMEEMGLLTSNPGWSGLAAVKSNAVYVADFDMFTQPSIGTLVDGISALACMFHPDIFDPQPYLAEKFVKFDYKKDLVNGINS
jgi:iron complex transport system substrate-binding protein